MVTEHTYDAIGPREEAPKNEKTEYWTRSSSRKTERCLDSI